MLLICSLIVCLNWKWNEPLRRSDGITVHPEFALCVNRLAMQAACASGHQRKNHVLLLATVARKSK